MIRVLLAKTNKANPSAISTETWNHMSSLFYSCQNRALKKETKKYVN